MRVPMALARIALVLLLTLAACGRSAESDGPAPAERLDSLAGMIVFVSGRTGQPELYSLRPDGTGLVQLTDGSLRNVDDPAVSPDGRTMAFTALPPGGVRPDIYLMRADGSDLRQFTPEVPDEAPAWSPDGDRIAFESDRTGDAEICVMRADGTGLRRLTSRPGDDLFPAWSPDGERIAFVADGDGGRDVWVMRSIGGEARALAPYDAPDGDPSWSPDGERIAFESNREGGPTSDIFVMFADGSGVLRLTDHPGDDEDPEWVPG
jgi:Tol biopolymer transport system component